MIRTADYPINELFTRRWSPRAMSGELITHEELMSLFEAARWAPSSFNIQPWRFVYAFNRTPQWDVLYDLLVPFNKEWCANAAVLLVIISRTNDGKGHDAPTHAYDTGAAWENLALQGSLNGLVVHGMSGFNYARARTELNVPADFVVQAMAAIGKPADKSVLSPELQKREEPSDRNKVSTFIFEGKM